jgi:hypothetical protein
LGVVPFQYLGAYLDIPSFLFVLLGVLLHVFLWGKPYFVTGMKAVANRPQNSHPKIAAYFQQLAIWTLGVGVVGMILSTILGIFLMHDPDKIGIAFGFSLLSFFYAGWLAVMVFQPISVRFSGDSELAPETSTRRWFTILRFPIFATLFVLVAFFLTRAVMALGIITMTTNDMSTLVLSRDLPLLGELTFFSINPANMRENFIDYLRNPVIFWDTPSLLFVFGSIGAFRLAAGKLRNRFDWIPVCILFGVLWSIGGLVIIFRGFNPEIYVLGCFVALLSVFYGLIAALVITVDKPWFCMKCSLVWGFVNLICALMNLNPDDHWMKYAVLFVPIIYGGLAELWYRFIFRRQSYHNSLPITELPA